MGAYRAKKYVGRGGDKLKFAIDALGLDLSRERVGADFGCNIGGFTDCLLREGVNKVYAVDTGYGMLEWKLRCDERVTVMERTNAMHVSLPEKVDIVVVDVAWTPQKHILPSALGAVKKGGRVLSLFKPQYEAGRDRLKRGVVEEEDFNVVLEHTLRDLKNAGIVVADIVRLPKPEKRKNTEAFLDIAIDGGRHLGA